MPTDLRLEAKKPFSCYAYWLTDREFVPLSQIGEW